MVEKAKVVHKQDHAIVSGCAFCFWLVGLGSGLILVAIIR